MLKVTEYAALSNTFLNRFLVECYDKILTFTNTYARSMYVFTSTISHLLSYMLLYHLSLMHFNPEQRILIYKGR